MSRRKEPAITNELLDQLLAGGAASAAFEQGSLLDSLKKALTKRALNAEMDHHLAADDGAGNTRNGYGRETVTTESSGHAVLDRAALQTIERSAPLPPIPKDREDDVFITVPVTFRVN